MHTATTPIKWSQEANKQNSRQFWKEIIYVGQFQSDGTEWEITEATIDHQVAEFGRYKAAGNVVFVCSEHREDAEHRLGSVLQIEARTNDRGLYSLWALIEFSDDESQTTGLKNNVSVFIDPQLIDGKGNEYRWYLRHVASTTRPVVPGLEPYQALATSTAFIASLATTPRAPVMDEILEALGLTIEGDDAAKIAGIVEAVVAMKEELAKLKDEKPAEETPAAAAPASEGANGDVAISASLPKGLVGQMTNARKREVDGLVSSKVVTPAHGDELRKAYCNNEAVSFSLNADSSESEFDRTVAALTRANKDFQASLPEDGLSLSHGDDGSENVLLADAKSRSAS